eukprot:scaffold89827_cov54-Phaeocystis_antarctica.AAC.2
MRARGRGRRQRAGRAPPRRTAPPFGAPPPAASSAPAPAGPAEGRAGLLNSTRRPRATPSTPPEPAALRASSPCRCPLGRHWRRRPRCCCSRPVEVTPVLQREHRSWVKSDGGFRVRGVRGAPSTPTTSFDGGDVSFTGSFRLTASNVMLRAREEGAAVMHGGRRR